MHIEHNNRYLFITIYRNILLYYIYYLKFWAKTIDISYFCVTTNRCLLKIYYNYNLQNRILIETHGPFKYIFFTNFIIYLLLFLVSCRFVSLSFKFTTIIIILFVLLNNKLFIYLSIKTFI